MRGVQIGVLFLVMVGLSATLISAGSLPVRNRMVPKLSSSSSGQTQYYSQQQQPLRADEDSSEEEDDLFDQDEPQSFLPRIQSPPPSPPKLPSSTSTVSRFSPARDGGDHRNVPSSASASATSTSTRNEERDRLLKLEALQQEEEERINFEQSQNAKYFFASAVDDGIMDQSQVRQESRDGQKVKGSYSYSDGFVKRTINYEADEDGYRVTKEESEPIGEGPMMDLINGKADIHTQVEGVNTQYSINADDIVLPSSSSSTLAPLPELKQQQHQQQQQQQQNFRTLKHPSHL